MRKFRAFGIAAIAALAMTAVAANAAQGAVFHGESAPVEFSGSQVTKHKFTVDGGSTTCSTATFSGSNASATSQTAVLAASYSGCKLFGLFNASVAMNGCEYEFVTDETDTTSPYAATVNIVNCGGEEIEVTSGVTACVVTVGEQGSLSSLSLTNVAGGDIEAAINVSGITYTENAECPSPGTRSNGTYTGSAKVEGEGQNIKVE